MGLNKGMSVNPSYKGDRAFGKFESNAIGDPYVDPGKYHLRKDGAAPSGTGSGAFGNSIGGATSHMKPFGPSGSNKTVRHSEFEHKHNGPPPRPQIESKPGFMNRKTAEPFTSLNKIGYGTDPYENK